MNEPIKVIHKYKNINRKIQYNVIIFVGNLLNENTNRVLKKIKDKSLIEALLELNDRDITIMNNEYGQYWYKYFYIDKHIRYTINKLIIGNEIKKKEIIKKYGQEWFNLHIQTDQNIAKVAYSFQSFFKQSKETKQSSQKIKSPDKKENDLVSYKISDDTKITISDDTEITMSGGDISDKAFVQNIKNRLDLEKSVYEIIRGTNETDNNNDDSDMESIDVTTDDTDDEIIKGGANDSDNNNDEIDMDLIDVTTDDGETKNVNVTETLIDVDVVDEFDIEELEKIGKEDVVYDKDVDKISNTLQQIITKSEIEKKDNIYSDIIKWNDIKDNNMYDEELINVYTKTYVYNQYICHDDTIKTIKNKISCGYQKSKIFDKNSQYFIPSRLYLWSEYQYIDADNKIKNDKIMIGQKWVRRNELLDVDIEPNINIRHYEILKGNLKYLQENIKKYASKTTFENDEQVVLSDYDDFMVNNEIYMLDIYNDLGLNYNSDQEQLKNMYDVYIKIYFNGISQDDFKNIIGYLNDNKVNESSKINLVYKNILNDQLMENEILKTVEEIKKTPKVYSGIFKENYITQSVIHIHLKHQNFKGSNKIELYRIFDNFIVNDKYPFIQFQTPEGKLVFKYYSLGTEYDKEAILSKWFENSPYGISFKVNVDQKGGKDNKYIAISLNDIGRMVYKTQWKEEDQATIEDVKKSYDEVRDLVRKINRENNKLKVEVPINDKFKFAFINTIQQFELPEKFLISHNDLSDFSRYFYPYIAVVIEPRKRQSKVLKYSKKSKYGTYLRYKKISKYENEASIEKRILYFLRNYEFNEKLLILEISKQFNITEKQASQKIVEVIEKYPNIKKSRNIHKKFENIPKYKPPGIGIDIQGKTRNKYKMRISGTRTNEQLFNIIKFMNILIYLYIETYLYKKPDRQKLKEKLKQLSNIAKRRNKVDDIIEVTETIKTVKQITKLDKERLGYKPEKGQNQWTRNCQNSGDNKKRRPIPYTDKQIEDMLQSGYQLNTVTGDYEKKVDVGKKSVILKAAKIDNYDGQGNAIYYTCDPAENGEYMYIGFLSRSSNPHGLCMPCCFKKDPTISKNKEKREYHMRCLGKMVTDTKSKKLMGDKLYILQDSNKTQTGRFSYLPYYLDFYLNTMLNKDKIIKNNYLISSDNGWFFKYGTTQDDDVFLTTISNALDISIQFIKDKITQVLLKEDNADAIFTSLNNGDIKTQFGSIDSYIRFIHTNYEIDYNIVADILSIPGVIHDHGLNIIIFEKISQFTQENSKKRLKDDFNILCANHENIHYYLNKEKINLLLIREDLNYYPIYQVRKDENSKVIEVDKTFKYDESKNSIIKHIYNYINISFSHTNFELTELDNAKTIFQKIEKYGLSEYYPTKQIIDNRNKSKYFVIQDKYLIPIKPSGSLFWIPIEYNYEKYVNNINDTSNILYHIYQKSNKQIKIKSVGIYYSSRTEKEYTVEALIIDKYINVPIKQIKMTYDMIIEYSKKYKIRVFLTESKSIYDAIDKELIDYKNKNKTKPTVIDKRIIEVNKDKYNHEGYELFRLELAYYLKDQDKLKERIIRLLSKSNINKIEKKKEIKKILFKLISKDLYDTYSEIESQDNIEENDDEAIDVDLEEVSTDDSSEYLDDTDLIPINMVELLGDNYKDVFEDDKETDKETDKEKETVKKTVKEKDKKKKKEKNHIKKQKGGSELDINNLSMFINTNRKLVQIDDKDKIDISYYDIKNNREICPTNTKEQCNVNPHCKWKSSNCIFRATSKQIIEYINKVSEELTNNELKSNELLMKEKYFVSDIYNRDNYTPRDNQKIIKSNNNNIKKLLSELFGKNNIPIIGKRRMNKISKNINETNLINPIENIGNKYYQTIHFTNPIYRAYANCYFWNRNTLMETNHRNLGHYSALQTDLANYFKSQIIDWIINKNNQKKLLDELGPIINLNKESFINDFKRYLARSNEILKSYVIDIYILSIIFKNTIYLYDNYDNIIGLFDNGLKYLSNFYGNDISNFETNNNKIHIKYNISSFSFTNTPSVISAIYLKII